MRLATAEQVEILEKQHGAGIGASSLRDLHRLCKSCWPLSVDF